MGKCPRRKQNEEPKCKNCWENGIKTEANHEAFSNKCKRSKVATAELLQLATEKGISIALVQEPYVGNQGILKQNPGTKVIQCTVGRQKPVKAAIIVFGDKVEVLHDPQLVTETESVVPLKIGRMKLGIISIYFEGDEDIEPYIIRTKKACKNLGTENLIIAGDINAWSHWWGSQREDRRGQAYRDFLDEMGFHILNTGSTPTFETYRGDRICSSIVDVTACSSPLIGRVENWRVDRTATTSDHNAIVFNLRLSGPIKPMEPITTRRYNTNKADWTEFCLQLRNTLQKYGIAEKVERTKRPEDLEANSREYIAAIQEVCEEIFPKIGQRKTKANPPWWTAELSALKKDVLRKKRRIRNAAPTRKKAVIEDYLTAKTIYTQKAEIAQTESWKEYCTTQDKESMWDKVYRVIRNKKAPGPDGLTADICIAAIESEMEVFLAIANKCLELAYFPALEDRTCRHNTETWKEDYTLLNPTGR
ncbi:Retrovirus-related Pol polyprotein from type-1 retrotransposable element R1 [Eumeta japonica]|uniref:Retrovirus-related Pol polyprotein from type-1 retrotransposable element R1 n=1 Tax=Eumeta variegata TaxID=151549 RepID=A0A4C2A3Q3_EUMVA|nr:Retrovirus-related Pol polyprotein from type-1 retrotransposable element R1 [Eumeta japonica]